MRVVLLVCFGLLSACAARPGVKPVADGMSRADGIVTMVSTGTIYNPVSPDWRAAQASGDPAVSSLGLRRLQLVRRLAGSVPGVRTFTAAAPAAV